MEGSEAPGLVTRLFEEGEKEKKMPIFKTKLS